MGSVKGFLRDPGLNIVPQRAGKVVADLKFHLLNAHSRPMRVLLVSSLVLRPPPEMSGTFSWRVGGLVKKLTIHVCSASGSRKCVGENVKIVQRKMAPLFLDLQEQICPKHISVEAKEGHYDIVFPLEEWLETFLME